MDFARLFTFSFVFRGVLLHLVEKSFPAPGFAKSEFINKTASGTSAAFQSILEELKMKLVQVAVPDQRNQVNR